MLTMRYNEPWCWHCPGTDPSAVWADTFDISSNWRCQCPHSNRGYDAIECAQADFNSNMTNPDGTLIGPDNGALWTDQSSNNSYRWIMNPDPEIPNWQLFTPGTTRAGNAEFREWYYQWGTAPSSPSNICRGLYYDSTGGWWAGWEVVHNFNPQHWPFYDFSPGIYWGSIQVNGTNYGDGLVCMWAPMSNVEFMKYAWFEMRKENRPIMANMGPSYEMFMAAPWLDMWGIESRIRRTCLPPEMAMERGHRRHQADVVPSCSRDERRHTADRRILLDGPALLPLPGHAQSRLLSQNAAAGHTRPDRSTSSSCPSWTPWMPPAGIPSPRPPRPTAPRP